MIKFSKAVYLDATHIFYAGDTGAFGTYDNIKVYFSSLKQFSPGCEYCPKPSKSVQIVLPDNILLGKYFGFHRGFIVFTGKSYLGGYIRDDMSKCYWLQYCTSKWEKNIHTISEMIRKYFQNFTPV